MVALREPSIPLVDAPALAPAARRTALLRLGLAAALTALLAACFLVARGLHPQPSSYFAGGGSGVLVLDFSTSIDPSRYRRIARVLHTLVRTSQPTGLVAYSDAAYDALPLGTRGEALKPLLRFFEIPAGDLGPLRPAGRSRDFFGYPRSPWSDSFRGGTRISRGLRVARQMLQREHVRNGTVVLVSDLDDSPFDTTALTEEAIRYREAGIDLRLVPLNPSPDDREMFVRLVGRDAFVANRELLANTAREEQRMLVGPFPLVLVLLAAALLLVLALNERACARLGWRAA
jgi:hypothetical protein